MEKLIKKVYEEKMQDGSFEKIVSEEFNKMVKNACESLFGYYGPLKKDIENKLKEVMGSLIDNTDFSSYVTKIQYIINEALEETAASDYKKVAESLKSILGQKHIETFSTIKASELFKEYCSFMANEELDESDLADHIDIDYDDGEKTAYLECVMQLDDYHKVLRFNCNDVNDFKETKYKFEIALTRNNEIRFKPKIALTDYRFLDQFTCYLLMLSNNWVKVELDKTYSTNDVNVRISD